MRAPFLPMIAALVVTAAACNHDDTDARQRLEAVTARLDDLERRLGAVERGVAPLDRLHDETTTLDRRVSALEATSHAPASTSPPQPTTTVSPSTATTTTIPHAAAAPSSGATRYDRDARREQLLTLSYEFRARMAALREGRTAGTMTPEDIKAIEDVLRWHQEQRRAILRGQGRTDQ